MKYIMKLATLTCAVFLISLSLVSCGQTGPLHLPETDEQGEPVDSDAPFFDETIDDGSF